MGRKLATLQVDSALRAVRVGGPVDEVAARVNEPLSNGKVEPTLAKRLLRSTLFRNFMGLMSATVAGRLLGLLTLGYAARALGPEAYGLVGYGQSVAAYASIALVPGLANWGLRAVARDRSQAGTLLAIVNGAKLALAVLALAGVAVFVWVAVADPRQQLVVLLSCAALVTQAAAADWVLNGLELSRISAGIGVVGTAIYTAGLLALVHQPGDLYLVPGLNLVASALVLVPTYVYLVRRCGVTVQKPASDEVRAALVAAVPLGVTSTLVVVLHYANNFIVHGFLGPTELGVYLAAFRLVELAGTLPSLLAGAFFPRLARTVAQAPDRAVREARLFARVHMVPGFCIAAMAFAEAPAVIDLIYGAKYAAAVPLLRIMAVAILFNYATCGYTNCLISFGKDKVMLGVVITSAVVSIGGGMALVPAMGSAGAAVTIGAVDLAGWLVSLRAYRAAVGSLQLAQWIRPFLGAVAAIAVSFALQAVDVPFIPRVIVALAAYAPVVWFEVKSAMN